MSLRDKMMANHSDNNDQQGSQSTNSNPTGQDQADNQLKANQDAHNQQNQAAEDHNEKVRSQGNSDGNSNGRSLKDRLVDAGKNVAKQGKDMAKSTAKSTAKKAESETLGQMDTYQDTKKVINKAKKAKKSVKKFKNGFNNTISWTARLVKFFLASGPLGWIALGVIVLTIFTLFSSSGKDGGWYDQNAYIAEQENPREDMQEDEKYVVLLEDCPPDQEFDYSAGDIQEGSGFGSWKQKGTTNYYRAKFTFEALVGMGFSNYGAAAAVGNAAIESGGQFHPAIVETAYADMYSRKVKDPDGGFWLSPSPMDYTGSHTNIHHGIAGRGLFQTSPGVLLAKADGINGFKWVDVFSGSDWKKNLFDAKKIGAGIVNEFEYYMLAYTGAGLSGTGQPGAKDAILAGSVVGSMSITKDFWEVKDVRKATEGFYFFFENGKLSTFYQPAGGEERVASAQFAYDEFKINGADKPNNNKLKEIGSGDYSIEATPRGANCKPASDNVDLSDVLEIAKALVGHIPYSQPERHSVIKYLKESDPVKAIQRANDAKTDCSGFVWLVYSIAGYDMPEWMDYTGSIWEDATGPQKYWKQIPASQAKAGDTIVHHGSALAHAAILLEDWSGYYTTPIVQEGGGITPNVSDTGMAGPTICEPYIFARPIRKK